ncbi:MAG: hypothetical protein MUP47_02170, partial [Phycisphaerae bacterium]|nr:hypothetical protein [Phycisphaerae bacterium]
PSAYLRYRRMGAEEAVKLPHNVVAEAVSQYGIPGGAVYLAIVVVVLVGMCRPATPVAASLSPPGRRGGVWMVAAAVAITAVISRWLFCEAGAYPSLLLLDGIVPAALLVAAVLAVTWTGSDSSAEDSVLSGGLRAALACGAVGVFLHSMVELSLFMPGPATAFWVVGGASLGSTGATGRDLAKLRWVLAVNALVVAVAAVAVFWWPVYRRTALTEAALRAWGRQDPASMAALAQQAARSDPLAGYAAADAARAVLAARVGHESASEGDGLIVAEKWAGQALRRDRAYYGHWVLAAEILSRLAASSDHGEGVAEKALADMGAAVQFNPMDHRLRLQAARMYVDAGKAAGSLAQLEAAEKINAALGAESLMRFESDEEAQVRLLRARAAALAATRPAG